MHGKTRSYFDNLTKNFEKLTSDYDLVFDEKLIETAKSYGVTAQKEYKKQGPNLEAANIIKNFKLLASTKYDEASDKARAHKNRRYLRKMGMVIDSEQVENSTDSEKETNTKSWTDWLKG